LAAPGRTRKPGRPLGVTLLAIWEFLNGVQMVLFGLVAMSVSEKVAEEDILKPVVFIVGLGSLVLGVWKLLLARGYVKGYESARRRGRSVALFAILLAVLGMTILRAVLSPESPIWTIVANLIIFWYLGSQKVVAFFRSHPRS
jgi:hypothetical protein